jgi:hypothetical protein
MPKKELADIEGEVQHETAKAYRFYDGKVTVWLPKSQCDWDPDTKTMTMEMWLAEDKGLV